MNCSRTLGKYRLQYEFDDLLSGNAEQYGGPLSMGLQVRHPVSGFPSSGVLAIRLDDSAGLSLFGSILIHDVVVFGIEFIAVQEKPEPILPALRVALVNGPARESREYIIFSAVQPIWKWHGNSICLDDAAIQITKLATPFEFDPLPTEITHHTDALHMTRTWHFDKSARLVTR